MKISFLTSTIALIFIAGMVNQVKAQAAGDVSSSVEWTVTTYDFGKIQQGKQVSAEFEFTNSSMIPLIITSVQPSCGCTVADYPKEPVQPGTGGKIVVTFNAASSGTFQKSILVNSNATEGYQTLIIKGEVASL